MEKLLGNLGNQIVQMFADIYQNRSVLVTGHTGFKGSWLSQWLLQLGAQVHGFALNPQSHEKLFDQLSMAEKLATDTRADICDRELLKETIDETQPDIIFHLAAQPLVRLSFDIPFDTFETNVMGTANLLESIRLLDHSCSVVLVTTDKCYENREWLHAYREEDAMGGYDPYSASKGCAELVSAAYRNSFFSVNSRQRIATARAGNVIGGGDWAKDRIVPDVFRALAKGESIPVRNKHATRPWQHVLEPLSGYLWLGATLAQDLDSGSYREQYCSAFNFGPSILSNRTVSEVVQSILSHTGGEWIDRSDPNAHHEASKLNLAIDKAFHLLGWRPTWDYDETILRTAEWYQAVTDGADPTSMVSQHISTFESNASEIGNPWASTMNQSQ